MTASSSSSSSSASSSSRRGDAAIKSEPASGLYGVLNVGHQATSKEIRTAYLERCKTLHPDVSVGDKRPFSSSPVTFEQVQEAYDILSDEEMRAVYDRTGRVGIETFRVVRERAAQSANTYRNEPISFEEYETAGTSLLSAAPGVDDDLSADAAEEDEGNDACPRSVEQAIYNATQHPDGATRYYALWWISRFRVAEAESALVNVLLDPTANGLHPNDFSRANALRRRAALALGNMAAPPAKGIDEYKFRDERTTGALARALDSDDYFLRYRCAEALARIAMRNGGREGFDAYTFLALSRLLERGCAKLERQSASASGFSKQESLFELDNLQPEVAAKLKTIFEQRRNAESKSRRTTMTPNLDVELHADDEPLEWALKAVGALGYVESKARVEQLLEHPIPLTKYAAHKAMYQFTKDAGYLEPIVAALEFGQEHHYSQRVLIRDLGDVGYAAAARAIANCGMVENSFKILALRTLLHNCGYDPVQAPELRAVYTYMDELL
ncbi:Phycocyanobilin lyase subunit alpha [Porphyridium purpureum]|uniref:Phycocyanobilin lyase subunit alpha n=1 Tax=Porphyridium purpureum TaxID=35688 RepID=A0A5J4YS20_PORPP|nr:Phycocyanobilin lyase subunit alpha [Porphyridium purpureum]|eukprot:POR3951..scf236_6